MPLGPGPGTASLLGGGTANPLLPLAGALPMVGTVLVTAPVAAAGSVCTPVAAGAAPAAEGPGCWPGNAGPVPTLAAAPVMRWYASFAAAFALAFLMSSADMGLVS
jgi:hypothetical protein